MAHRDYSLFCRYCLTQCWCMVNSYTPDALLKSTIISIPKDSAASLTRSDNYRGISLFNSICKLFDHVILLLFGGQLEASDMQFRFKRGHSKDSAASLTRSDNYRGISLFNSICKLFDHVILLSFGGQLEASDMQFGFKRGHSTVMCSLIFKEIVDHCLHSRLCF